MWVDLIGQRFGKLTVTKKLGLNDHKGMMWNGQLIA